MSVEVIAKILQADIVSSTAADVYARNTNPKITDVSQVPKHLYMCLSDIFQGTGKAATWPAMVAIKYGSGTTTNAGIDLIYQTGESVSAGQNNDKSDTPGSEYSILHTLCKLQNVAPTQKDTVDAADLRIRYLIDCLLRSKWAKVSPPVVSVGGIGSEINPIGLDNTVDPNEKYYCRWIQFDMAASDSRQRASIFSLNFTRLFF